MIRIAVNGACGRMGGRIISLVLDDQELELVAALERHDHQLIGKDIGLIAGAGETGIRVSPELNTVPDVVIDFSSPESALSIAEICANKRIALVIGTTGFNSQQQEKLRQISGTIPCLVSPNMSIGVNMMFDLVYQLARGIGNEYDIEIVEIHHRFKKDAPSGTALRLAEKVCEATGRDMESDVIYGRNGLTGERPRAQIGVHSVRSGDVIGDHTVIFGNLGERIEITHRAHTRDTFVRGAIKAAKFIARKPPKMYSMTDVLNLQTSSIAKQD